jgi:hypothetical protein
MIPDAERTLKGVRSIGTFTLLHLKKYKLFSQDDKNFANF